MIDPVDTPPIGEAKSGDQIKQRFFGSGYAVAGEQRDVRSLGKSPQEVRDLVRDAAAKALGYVSFDAVPSGQLVWLTQNIDPANLFKLGVDGL